MHRRRALFVLLALAALAAEPAPAPDAKPRELPADLPAVELPRPEPARDSFVQTIRWQPVSPLVKRPVPESSAGRILQAGGVAPPDEQPLVELPPGQLLNYAIDDSTIIQLDGVVRGYYRNDQRIEWTGLEDTFGAEAILRPALQVTEGPWTISAEAEFFINQPYGSSILSDPIRDLYKANFNYPVFQIFQLYAQVQRGDSTLRIGRSRTPFGSYDAPMFSNGLFDAPFLRTEAVGFAETGIFYHWQPGRWSFDLAMVNGEIELDTNSSKAVIARIGRERDAWRYGISAKFHDGISSEQQKRYNNHVGFDAAWQRGPWTVYGEALLDAYGFYRDFNNQGNPMGLGNRSLYGRDFYRGVRAPIYGVGWHAGVVRRGERLLLDLNFGSYYPEPLGVPFHDEPIHRGLIKAAYTVSRNLQYFTVAIVENQRTQEQAAFRNPKPFAIITGFQLVY